MGRARLIESCHLLTALARTDYAVWEKWLQTLSVCGDTWDLLIRDMGNRRAKPAVAYSREWDDHESNSAHGHHTGCSRLCCDARFQIAGCGRSRGNIISCCLKNIRVEVNHPGSSRINRLTRMAW